MTSTILRRLTAGAATAAVVSAGVLIGSSAAFAQPAAEPTETATATAEPEPTEEPSSEPTTQPSEEPTEEPSEEPSTEPTDEATEEPTEDPEDEAPEFDPQVTVIPTQITAADLTNPDKGIEVMVKNLMAGDVVTDSLTGEKNTAEGETLTTNLHYGGDASGFKVGQKIDFTVTVSREGEEDKTFELTVTIVGEDDGDDEAPAFDPHVNAKPTEITAADLTNPDKGIEVTAVNLMAGDVVTDSLTGEKNTAEGETLTTSLYYDGDASDFKVGQRIDFTVTVSREGEEDKTFEFTVTIVGEDDGEDEAAEAKLTVSPEKISVADFRNEKKGVTLTVENCEPGASVTFTVEHESGEPNHEVMATADDKGTATIPHIYGTGNAADSAYTGTYNVTATCGDAKATASFTVTSGSDDDGKGGGDTDKGGDQDSRNGNELPRTGSDLNALYGAAALLAVGAASLAVGRRKKSRD